MVPDFSMFLLVFSAIVLATTKQTHQNIAKVKTSILVFPKFRFHTLTRSKLHFSELMNFAIDFDQLFVRIFGNFWYQSIRKPQENVFLLGAKFKNNFETILHDLLFYRKPK